jgi:hypothetical protein
MDRGPIAGRDNRFSLFQIFHSQPRIQRVMEAFLPRG